MAQPSRPIEWGRKRQILIEALLGTLGVAVIGTALFFLIYRAPTCTDGKQDGSEIGVDCGVSCAYACTSQETPPVVTFSRAVSPQPGRTDFIAYISNTNANAGAEAASYTVILHSRTGSVLAQKTGTITLPPDSTVPLYIPALYQGSEIPAKPILSIDTNAIKWLKNVSQPVLPTPNDIQIQDGTSPRIAATLSNPSTYPITDQIEIVTVFNSQNLPIAASQTVVPELQPKGTAPVVFTWNEPFPGKAVRAEILPTFGS